MSYDTGDTICAIGTAAGGAALGMVRISGPLAMDLVSQVVIPDGAQSLNAAASAAMITGQVRVSLDRAVPRELPCDVKLWPTARSYTREPLAEIYTLGSPPLVEALLGAACRAGARLAEPGEFTLRAFLAGRIDLTQAEAVLGVIDARGNDELDSALSQLAGGLARPLHHLRDDLLQLLAELEAGLDFVDEDIEFITREELLRRLAGAEMLLNEVSNQMSARFAADVATRVVLVGPPNAGKSSLFNALVARCGRTTSSSNRPAIVSPQCGTTRDYVTATIDLGGIMCELIDTAGVDGNVSQLGERAELEIESAAQSLAYERRKAATVRLFCVDATQFESHSAAESHDAQAIALTKCDLRLSFDLSARSPIEFMTDRCVIATSSNTGEGLDTLCDTLHDLVTRDVVAPNGLVVAATADRCRETVRLAAGALNHAAEIVTNYAGNELAAGELRVAVAELGKVVGAVYTDDLLDRVFSTFCIGK